MSAATAWRVRHEGSPKTIDNLTLQEVGEGLQEGLWEPTDEVRGPSDADWMRIESHPLLEEAAAEIDAPPPRVYDDESRLDMNALIDVCLVLLVFFILTTSYAVLTKRMDTPDVAPNDKSNLPVMTKKQVEEQTISVQVRTENGQPVYRIEGEIVDPALLNAEIKRRASLTRKTTILLQHDRKVPFGAVVRVQDAAAGAGMAKVLVVVPEKDK